MPDMIIGSYAIVDGPRGGSYTIRRPSLEVYTCDCPPFRSLGTVAPEAKTCRHLIEYRERSEEFARVMEANPSRPALAAILASLPNRLRWGFRLFLHEQGFYPILASTPDALNQPASPHVWTPPTQSSNDLSALPLNGPSNSPVQVTIGYLHVGGTLENTLMAPQGELSTTISTIGYRQEAPIKEPAKPPITHWERLITSPFD